MRTLFPFLFLLAFAGCAGRDSRLAGLIGRLDHESLDAREQVQREIIEHCKGSADIWRAGAQLAKARETGSPEASRRLAFIENEIGRVELPEARDRLQSAGPDACGDSHIEGMPFFIVLITSADMLRFYRPVAQPDRDLKMPDDDFSKTALFSLTSTNFGVKKDQLFEIMIGKHAFKRDFRSHGLELSLNLVGGGPEWPKDWTTPETGGMDHVFKLSDLPLSIRAYGPAPAADSRVVWKFEAADAEWKDVDAVIKSRNVAAYRKLAEKLDDSVSVETRRRFLQETYMTDPLLPYVMFMHMAGKYPKSL